ncbi:MAG TPA: hypothetical protein VGO62_02070 [Myxococcota bacterium]|jgi:hypothetical protein
MKTKRRAYILMEVAISGALLAILAGELLSTLADARVKNVVSGRDVVASQLALAKIEQQRSLGYLNVGTDTGPSCSSGGTVENPVAGPAANYTRTCTAAAMPGTNINVNGKIVKCRDVDVAVKYNAHTSFTISNPTGDRTVTLRSRVCQ